MRVWRVLRTVALALHAWAAVAASGEQVQPQPAGAAKQPAEVFTAQWRPKIAIVPFFDTNALAQRNRFGAAVSAMLVTAFKNKSNFIVVEREHIARLIDETVLTSSDFFKKLPQGEETRKLDVHVLLLGNVSQPSDKQVAIDTKLLSPEGSWKVLVAVDRACRDISQIVHRRYGTVIAADEEAAQKGDAISALRYEVNQLAQRLDFEYLRSELGNLAIQVKFYRDAKATKPLLPTELRIEPGDYPRITIRPFLLSRELRDPDYDPENVAYFRETLQSVDSQMHVVEKNLLRGHYVLKAEAHRWRFVPRNEAERVKAATRVFRGKTAEELTRMADEDGAQYAAVIARRTTRAELRMEPITGNVRFVSSGPELALLHVTYRGNVEFRGPVTDVLVRTLPVSWNYDRSLGAFEKNSVLYKYTLAKEGYYDRDGEFEVTPGEQTVRLKALPRAQGHILVDIHPRGVAKVVLDGKTERDVTDGDKGQVRIKLVDSGPHTVAVSMWPYKTFREEVHVKRIDEEDLEKDTGYTVITCHLEILPGVLQILSAPKGAEVLLDGRSIGTAPIQNLEVPVGKHNFVARLARHFDATKSLEIQGGEKRDILLELLPSTGEVNVTTVPAGASVIVDGEPSGRGPITGLHLPIGEHTIAAKLDRHFEATSSFRIVGGEKREVLLKLNSAEGVISIKTVPTGAEIRLDGEHSGRAPVTIREVAVGAHTVMARLDRYFDETQKVDVESAETTDIILTLKPSTQLTIASVPGQARVAIAGESRGTAPLEAVTVPAGTADVGLDLARTYYRYGWQGSLRADHERHNRYRIRMHRVNSYGVTSSLWRGVLKSCKDSFDSSALGGLIVSPLALGYGAVGSIFTLPADAYVMLAYPKPGKVADLSEPTGQEVEQSLEKRVIERKPVP